MEQLDLFSDPSLSDPTSGYDKQINANRELIKILKKKIALAQKNDRRLVHQRSTRVGQAIIESGLLAKVKWQSTRNCPSCWAICGRPVEGYSQQNAIEPTDPAAIELAERFFPVGGEWGGFILTGGGRDYITINRHYSGTTLFVGGFHSISGDAYFKLFVKKYNLNVSIS